MFEVNMELKKGMIVKIIQPKDYDDFILEKYIGKIGIIYKIHDGFYFDDDGDINQIEVYFGRNEYDIFFKDELKIICFEEQSNMFRGSCFCCKEKTKKITIGNKNFNFTMSYCPKCLR